MQMEELSPFSLAQAMPHPPVHTSLRLHWTNLAVQHFRHRPSFINIPATNHHLIVFNIGDHLLIEKRHENGRCERRWAEKGQLSITPAGHPLIRHAKTKADLLFIHLAPALVEEVAGRVFGVKPVEVTIHSRFAIDDPVLNQLAQMMHAELIGGAPGAELAAVGLAQAIALNVLRRHSNLASPDKVPSIAGLSTGRLRQIIDHMQACLQGELTLPTLAAILGLSPSHFARAFREATGQSPHHFLIDLRIARARELLDTTKLTVTEVGLECGFKHPTHFSTAFRKMTGVSPRTWRNTHWL